MTKFNFTVQQANWTVTINAMFTKRLRNKYRPSS